MKAKMRYAKLIEEERKEVKRAILKAWGHVCFDWVEMCGGECSRNEAWQGSTDANLPSERGGLSRELEDKLYRLSPADERKLKVECFPFVNVS